MSEAKQILADIEPWLRSEGLWPELGDYEPTIAARPSPFYTIDIMKSKEGPGFEYEIKGEVQAHQRSVIIDGVQMVEKCYICRPFCTEGFGTFLPLTTRTLRISDILLVFLLRTIGLEELTVWQAKRKG